MKPPFADYPDWDFLSRKQTTMTAFLRASVLLAILSLAGCSFNRSDFVAGPNGQASPGGVSDSGKELGDVIRNHGPSYRLNF
jgi:hypothetical protein